MSRPRLRRIACVLGALLLLSLTVTPLEPAYADESDGSGLPDAGITVTMDSLTPSTLPAKGRIHVSGTITNASSSTWRNLKAYLLTSSSPITTEKELDEAGETDPTADVGGRLYREGLFDEVGDLEPGMSTSFTLDVRRSDLEITGQPGVYWIGVHVLGTNEDGRDNTADARARSFIPLMTAKGPRTRLALVVPVRAKVVRDSRGRLVGQEAWRHLLGDDGRLGRLMEVTQDAGTDEFTWAVDPAVLDAAASLAADNPEMSIAPTVTQDGESVPPDGSPSATSSDGTSTGGDPDAADAAQATPSASSLTAKQWLQTVRRRLEQQTVLSVPYGDLDVASALTAGAADLYRTATRLSTSTMSALGARSSPLVMPINGLLPQEALDTLPGAPRVLLSDAAYPDAHGPVLDGSGTSTDDSGRTVVRIDSGASSGGPSPTPRYAALAVRQRILAAAAVHALESASTPSEQPDQSARSRQPLVVATPDSWDPGPDAAQADFFPGLDVPWLRLVGLPGASAASPAPSAARYPQAAAKREVPAANITASRQLVEEGRILAGLLTLNDTVDEELAKAAMLGSSYHVRRHPLRALARTRERLLTVQSRLDEVHIEGPAFVTMSSEQGPIGVTVVNDLEEPVTVGVHAETEGTSLAIRDAKPIRLAAGQRASIRLRASAREVGVHAVTLMPTNADGAPVGDPIRFNVRSSQVGLVIWIIMGAGAVVLFGTAGYRIVRRVRAANP